MSEKTPGYTVGDLHPSGSGPCITQQHMQSLIAAEYFISPGEAIRTIGAPSMVELDLITICVLVLKNGCTILGESVCVSYENFDPDQGRKFAKEAAMEKLEELEGYALKARLSAH